MKNIPSRIFLTLAAIFLTVRSIRSEYPVGSMTAKQLVVVVTDNWDGVSAKLFGFEKRKGTWQLQFSFAAVVGEKGMALGEGIQNITINGAPQKKEGDLKSPAGIFFLGPAFGYASKTETKWLHMPYVCATDTLVCIDDPRSARYNELVKSDTVEKDWNSHEEMHRKDQDYKWGIYVQHNYHPVKPGNGSCIFLHIWEGAGKGTAGCTAMEEKNIITLLQWIRGDKHPVLVQFPEKVYNQLRRRYSMPAL